MESINYLKPEFFERWTSWFKCGVLSHDSLVATIKIINKITEDSLLDIEKGQEEKRPISLRNTADLDMQDNVMISGPIAKGTVMLKSIPSMGLFGIQTKTQNRDADHYRTRRIVSKVKEVLGLQEELRRFDIAKQMHNKGIGKERINGFFGWRDDFSVEVYYKVDKDQNQYRSKAGAEYNATFEVQHTLTDKDGNEKTECWPGQVKTFKAWGSHFTVTVTAKGSRMDIIASPSDTGWCVAVVNHGIAVDLAGPSNESYTCEKLIKYGMNELDAASVAAGLYKLYENGMLSYSNDEVM